MIRSLLSPGPVQRDLGLLIARLGFGLPMLLLHGWDKLVAGPEKWEAVGGGMAKLGITFAPTVWGFLAACAESLAAGLIVLGLFFRPATLMLGFTMFVAAFHHLSLPADAKGAGFAGAELAILYLVASLALFFTGPGRIAIALGRRSPTA
jgi:putative oxidoreductase